MTIILALPDFCVRPPHFDVILGGHTLLPAHRVREQHFAMNHNQRCFLRNIDDVAIFKQNRINIDSLRITSPFGTTVRAFATKRLISCASCIRRLASSLVEDWAESDASSSFAARDSASLSDAEPLMGDKAELRSSATCCSGGLFQNRTHSGTIRQYHGMFTGVCLQPAPEWCRHSGQCSRLRYRHFATYGLGAELIG